MGGITFSSRKNRIGAIRAFFFPLLIFEQLFLRLFWRRKFMLILYFVHCALALISLLIIMMIVLPLTKELPLQRKEEGSTHLIKDQKFHILGNVSEADFQQFENSAKKLSIELFLNEPPNFILENTYSSRKDENLKYPLIEIHQLNFTNQIFDYRLRQDQIDTTIWTSGNPFGDNIFSYAKMFRFKFEYSFSERLSRMRNQLTTDAIFLDALGLINITEMTKTPIILRSISKQFEYWFTDTGNIFTSLPLGVEFLMFVPSLMLIRDFLNIRRSVRLARSLGVSRLQIFLVKLIHAFILLAPISLLSIILLLHIYAWFWKTWIQWCVFGLALLYSLCRALQVLLLDELFGSCAYFPILATIILNLIMIITTYMLRPVLVDIWQTVAICTFNPTIAFNLGIETVFTGLPTLEDTSYITPFPTILSVEHYFIPLLLHAFAILFMILLCSLLKDTLFFNFKLKSTKTSSKFARKEEVLCLEHIRKEWRKGEITLMDVNICTKMNRATILLGENGSGKSTLFSLICENIAPTSGEIFINGKNFATHRRDCQRLIGFCPQYDPVLPEYTVFEHLVLYFRLRTLRYEMHADIQSMAELVKFSNMMEQMEQKAISLSTGQKRKLFVMCALVGDPKVVLLDEPTTGMDQLSRKEFANLITKFKKNRSIIITSHYVDEASSLGDDIAILLDGEILCHDSIENLYQKHVNGVVINVKFARNSFKNVQNYSNHENVVLSKGEILERVVRNVTRGCAFVLPDDGSDLVNVGIDRLKVFLPASSRAMLPQLLEELNLQRLKLEIENFTIADNLEEIFMNLTRGTPKNVKKPSIHRTKLSKIECHSDFFSLTIQQMVGLFQCAIISFWRCIFYYIPPYLLLIMAYIWPVLVYYDVLSPLGNIVRDRPISLIEETKLKVLFYNKRLKNRNITFFESHYTPSNESGINSIQFADVDNYIKVLWNFIDSKAKHFFPLGVTQDINYADLFHEIEHRVTNPPLGFEFIFDESQPLGFSKYPHEIRYNVWLNYAEIYAVNFYSNLILHNKFGNGAYIKSGLFVPKQLIIPEMPVIPEKYLLPAVFTILYSVFIYLEATIQNTEFPYMIHLTNVSMFLQIFVQGLVYYLNFLLFFLIYNLIICSYFQKLIYALNYSQFVMLTAVAETVYVFTFGSIWRRSPIRGSSLYIFLFSLLPYVLISSGIDTFYLMLYRLSARRIDIMSIIFGFQRTIFPLLPITIFFDSAIEVFSLLEMSTSHYFKYISSLSLSIILSVLSLVVLKTSIIRWTLTRLSARLHYRLIFTKMWWSETRNFWDENEPEEHCNVCNVQNVYKFYNGQTCAVHDVTLDVRGGECLGLLGTNGAGKSSLSKILVNKTYPSYGTVKVNGQSLAWGVSKVVSIGYCPQEETLLPWLTVAETLTVIGRMYGVKDLKKQVRALIEYLGLEEKSNRKVKTLSGGQKRRLSLGLAYFNDRKALTVLDEPTVGMDIRSRWKAWHLIDVIVARSPSNGTILTTHNMEECERLCQRIAFMHDARLTAVGTIQCLKKELIKNVDLKLHIHPDDVDENKVKNLHTLIMTTFNVVRDNISYEDPVDEDPIRKFCDRIFEKTQVSLIYEIQLENGETWTALYLRISHLLTSDTIVGEPIPRLSDIIVCPASMERVFKTLANKIII